MKVVSSAVFLSLTVLFTAGLLLSVCPEALHVHERSPSAGVFAAGQAPCYCPFELQRNSWESYRGGCTTADLA